jgi:hypothetical protein
MELLTNKLSNYEVSELENMTDEQIKEKVVEGNSMLTSIIMNRESLDPEELFNEFQKEIDHVNSIDEKKMTVFFKTFYDRVFDIMGIEKDTRSEAIEMVAASYDMVAEDTDLYFTVYPTLPRVPAGTNEAMTKLARAIRAAA